MNIVQISDLHIRERGVLSYGRVDTLSMAEAAIARVRALDLRPDAVVVTGDVTECGLPAEYEIAAALLGTLGVPVYVTPGNHDRAGVMAAALRGRHPYLPDSGRLHFVVEDHPVRLVVLDTTILGETHGELGDDDIRWLARTLDEGRGRPTLIAMHHPPFAVGVAGMDEIWCRNGEAMAAVVRRHPEVERVVCGHHHRAMTVRFGGTVGYVAPSVVHQVWLELRPGLPNRFVMEPPCIAVHTYDPAVGMVSHLLPTDDFGAPFDVVESADYPGRSGHARG